MQIVEKYILNYVENSVKTNVENDFKTNIKNYHFLHIFFSILSMTQILKLFSILKCLKIRFWVQFCGHFSIEKML